MADIKRQSGSPDRRIVIILLTFSLLVALASSAIGQSGDRQAPLTVGEITIITNDIFSAEEARNTNGALRFLRKSMNAVHFNTRHHVIRRELLFKTGENFSSDVLSETERNLRELGFLNNVHVTAVDTTADGRVNVLVSTREAWTLRTSVSYSRASGGDQRWSVSGSDGNFLGYGTTVGAGLGADENSSYWNLWYRQRRLFKSGFWLGLDYSNREDGHTRRIVFMRPFYALDDPWGMEFWAWDRQYDERYYLSNGGPAGLDASDPYRLYSLLAYREKGIQARFQIRRSERESERIWRIGGGVDVVDRQFHGDLAQVALSDGRVADLTWLAEPGRPYAREQGVEVTPFLWLHTEGRRWAKSRYVLRYGQIEDVSLAWLLDVKVGPRGGTVGSTSGYAESRWHGEAIYQRWYPAGKGFLVTQLSGQADVGSENVSTYKYDAVLGWTGKTGAEMSPWLTRVFAEYAQGRNLLGSNALTLGLDRGLRTLDFDGMAGDRLMRWNVEQGKALPWEVAGLMRAGVAAFYSGGSAWWRDEDRGTDDIRHEAGFGLRFGPTRSARSEIARIDLTWNLNGSGGPVITAITRGFF